uniref:Putative secreted protein n=1 Tax=Ixodes ricinus TaxID=34613 RepID=A0A6B0URV8_IXORI
MTQHLHLGFFLIITCSTVEGSEGGTTMPCCTSTSPFLRLAGVEPLVSCLRSAPRGPGAREGATLVSPPPLARLPSPWSPRKPSASPLTGVMGLPSLIRLTIVSASLLSSPSGRNGLSRPLSRALGTTTQYR